MATASIIFDLVGRDRASGDFDRVGRSADRAGGKLRKMGQIAKLAGLGVAAGAGVAAVGLFKLAQGAAEDEVGAKKMALAFRNAAGATDQQVASVENWITKAGIAKGVADDQLRPALTKLVAATGDVDKAQRLAGLAMNVSAGTGMSLEAVSKSLARAQNGNVASLGRLGISTKDANGKTVDLETALGRLAKVHKGSAAAAADTYEGKMRRMKLVLSETGESIGYKLLPIFTKMATWFLNDGLPKAQRFGDYLGRTLPPLIANLREKVGPVVAWLRTNVPPTFERIKAVVTTVMTGLASGTGERMAKIKSIFLDGISIVKSLWATFGPAITRYVIPTMQNIQRVVGGVLTWLSGAFKVVSSLLKGDWSGMWNGITTMLRGAAGIVTGIVRQLWATLRFAFTSGGTIIKSAFSGLWSGIKSLASTGASALVNAVKGIPGRLLSLGKAFAGAGKNLVSKLWEGVSDVASNPGGFISDLVGKIKSAINSKLSLPLKVSLPGPLGGKSITVIPAFRRGGIAPGGTALVGEDGPELVDLPRGSRVTPNGASMRRLNGNGGGGGDLHVHLHLSGSFVGDEAKLGSELERVMVRYQRRVNRPLEFATR